MGQYSLSTQIDSNKIFLVKHSELEERFDPAFYKPEYTNLLSRHKKWNRCKDISRSIQHPPEYERIYSEKGIQLIRSQNVRPTGLNLNENPVFFSADFLKGKKVIFPAIGDVLIVRSGVNAGDVATIDKNITSAIIGADNLLLKPDEGKVLPKFIQVYFTTNLGRTLLNRYLTGATNTHISPYYLSRVQIPEVSTEIQRICVKLYEDSLNVKQQKEAEAKALLESIDTYLLEELGISLPEQDNSLEKRIFTTKFSEVTGGRIDPFYNNISYVQVEKRVKNCKYPTKKIKDVCFSVSGVIYSSSDERSNGKEILRGNNITLETNELNFTSIRYVRDDLNLSDNLKLRKNDILMSSASGSKEHVGKVAFIEEDMNFYFGGFMMVLRQKNTEYNQRYFFEFLQSSIFRRYLFKSLGGTNINNLNFNMLSNIEIPFPPFNKQTEIYEKTQGLRKQAKALQQEAVRVLEEAKREVERMIIGE